MREASSWSRGWAAWAARWQGIAGVSRIGPATQLAPGLSSVDIGVSGDPEGTAARALVGKVRADRPPGGQSWVTGDAALLIDLLGLLESRLPSRGAPRWPAGIVGSMTHCARYRAAALACASTVLAGRPRWARRFPRP